MDIAVWTLIVDIKCGHSSGDSKKRPSTGHSSGDSKCGHSSVDIAVVTFIVDIAAWA